MERKDVRPIYHPINGRPSNGSQPQPSYVNYGNNSRSYVSVGASSPSTLVGNSSQSTSNHRFAGYTNNYGNYSDVGTASSHYSQPTTSSSGRHIYSTLNNNNNSVTNSYSHPRLLPSSTSLSPPSVATTTSSLRAYPSSDGFRGAVGEHRTQPQPHTHLSHQQPSHYSHQPQQESSRYLRSLKNNKEDEVDKLTDLLVRSMENSNDPDFFGVCFKCNGKVQGEGSGCTAMGQIYHIRCFTCKSCHKELRGLPFYNVDGNPLCEQDYLNTLEKCSVCQRPILDRILRATGKPYHPTCFTCVVCGKCLDGIPFTVDNANRIHCIEDFHRKFAPRCCVCSRPILPEPGQHETVRIVALDKSYHVNCYRCEDCHMQLTSGEEGRGCYPLDDHILCLKCNTRRVNALTTP